MTEPSFFRPRSPLELGEILALTGIAEAERDGAIHIAGARPLDIAGPEDITFCDNADYLDDLR
ncbi:MAG TPA: UDP-3-O-(3-hydroxymyristoyl)glucosamine N-acyltransferase, partial [Xanthobacteraceae bacterium]|nr:UDP-3-O-(3-hydroxymyristoyl)glucosamine N-acyltransferase [Xanthobacteraceae bacterium]